MWRLLEEGGYCSKSSNMVTNKELHNKREGTDLTILSNYLLADSCVRSSIL